MALRVFDTAAPRPTHEQRRAQPGAGCAHRAYRRTAVPDPPPLARGEGRGGAFLQISTTRGGHAP